MFKKTLLAAVVVSLSAITAVVHADESAGYLFVSAGQSDADISKQQLDNFWGVAPGLGVSSSLDTKDTAFKIGAGVQLNPYVAIEFQYLDLGTAEYKASDAFDEAKTTAQTDGLGINAVGTIGFDRLSLFGKVGYHQLKTKAKNSATFLISQSDSEKENVMSLGLGAAFALNESFSLVAEYERYQDVADEYDVDMLSAGMRYNF